MQSINLIPQQEVQEQSKVKAVLMSTWITIFLTLIFGGISGYYIYTTRELDTQIKGLDAQIEDYRKAIITLAPIEVSARNLDQKYTILKDIFSNRVLYSLLGAEIQARTPDGVAIESITIQKGASLNISGNADNYINVAAFTNNLVSTTYENGDPTLKNLFSTVVLNSVSLEKTKNIVKFSINVELNENLLRRK